MAAQKLRQPDSFEDAVTRIMGELSADGCGEIIKKSASLVRQAADPDAEYQFNLNQALALDVAYVTLTGREAPIMTAYRRQARKVSGPSHTPCDRADRIASFAKEAGEGLSAYTLLKGERVSPNDGAAAIQELDELMDVIRLMRRDIEVAMNPGESAEAAQ